MNPIQAQRNAFKQQMGQFHSQLKVRDNFYQNNLLIIYFYYKYDHLETNFIARSFIKRFYFPTNVWYARFI